MKDLGKYILLLNILLSFAVSAYAEPDTLRLGLGEAIDIARERNLAHQASLVGVERARKDKQVALSKLFPTVAVNAQYGYTLKKQKVYFGSEGGGNSPMASFMPNDGIEMGQKHNLTTTLNASVPLVAPQLWASLAMDNLSVERALEQARSSELGLKSEVRKAFTAVLLAEESLRVLQQSYANMEANQQSIKEKFKRGLVAEYDVIRMESQLKKLKPTLIQTEQQLHLAKMKLLVLMNLEPQQNLSLKEKLTDYEVHLEANMLVGQDSLDMVNNQVLRELALNLRQIKEGIKVKRAEFLPTLGLAFNYSQNFASDYFRLDNNRRWTPHALVALSFSMPLYTGGSTYKGLSSLKLQAQQLQLQKLNTERQLSLQGRNAQDALHFAREQYIAACEAVKSATKGRNIAEVRYKVGASTLLELNDAELAQRQAELNKAQAIYNYLLALYAIEELQGR